MRRVMVLVAACTLSGAVYAQSYFSEGNFAPRVEKKPDPPGRGVDTTTNPPQKMDFSVDFSATQTPLERPRRDRAAPGPNAQRSGATDRPVDQALEASMTNSYASRTDDAPAQASRRRDSAMER